MTQTTIYLSVARGTESLILDGHLCLLGELLAALKNVPYGFIRSDPLPVDLPSQSPEQSEERLSGAP